ncbi:hypothetical protein FOMG_18609 [Fusarium oxysporum f. sp. melonis 26406]|uniref:Uncharacterized protein n=1 Tax=Fusarium oxysporum f. sp. melonis 26406 TaxID=1089452 RepID=W9YYP3_FUSOX|nr:hypothetical protein FOMG_18609 [Fusarium oxysporum f. sp. melonis 26406]
MLQAICCLPLSWQPQPGPLPLTTSLKRPPGTSIRFQRALWAQCVYSGNSPDFCQMNIPPGDSLILSSCSTRRVYVLALSSL